MENKLKKLISDIEDAYDGDSNDEQHDAAFALVEYLKEHTISREYKLLQRVLRAIDKVEATWESGDLADAVSDLTSLASEIKREVL